jgi:hypothetical protein
VSAAVCFLPDEFERYDDYVYACRDAHVAPVSWNDFNDLKEQEQMPVFEYVARPAPKAENLEEPALLQQQAD